MSFCINYSFHQPNHCDIFAIIIFYSFLSVSVTVSLCRCVDRLLWFLGLQERKEVEKKQKKKRRKKKIEMKKNTEQVFQFNRMRWGDATHTKNECSKKKKIWTRKYESSITFRFGSPVLSRCFVSNSFISSLSEMIIFVKSYSLNLYARNYCVLDFNFFFVLSLWFCFDRPFDKCQCL